MPGASSSEPTFIDLYGYILWPILGVLGGLILIIGGYAIWRGPHRAFFPPSLTNKFRKNIVDDEADFNEKRNHPLGRVPSPVRPPPRVYRERRERRSRADAFKQEVMAAQGREMQWDNMSEMGMNRGLRGQEGGSPMSENGTLVGSAWGKEEHLSSDLPYADTYTPTRPQRPPSSLIMEQQDVFVTSPDSQTRSTFEDSPQSPAVITRPKRVSSMQTQQAGTLPRYSTSPASTTTSTLAETITDPAVIARPRRMSSMQTQQARVQTRYTQRFQGYNSEMKEGEESDVW